MTVLGSSQSSGTMSMKDLSSRRSLRTLGLAVFVYGTLMGLWIVLLALTAHDALLEPTSAKGAAFGMVAAAATLTKPVALLLPCAFLPLALWHWRRAGVRLRDQLAVSGVMFACLAVLL